MKAILFTLALLLCTSLFAQRTIDDILAQKEIKRPVYALKTNMLEAIVVNMSYGEDEVISETDRQLLLKSTVVSVDLVFTDFPKGEKLTELNRRRIQKIWNLRKSIITDHSIEWKVIRQTNCSNESEAKVLFHGVVIHYRAQSEKETERDLGRMSIMPKTGKELSKMVARDKPYGVKLADTSLLTILTRNKSWTDMLIVSDLTGSMSPYTNQLLVWFQLRMKDNKVKQVVFFNDGDMKAESAKKVGEIGGIYTTRTSTYEDILLAAEATIKGGYGGDGPENNCEGLLEGIAITPAAKDIILIADNFASVKDIALLDKITKPVRVIVCGAELGPIHPHYLEIARKTGGSVHTMSDDITNLAEINEGAEITIQKRKYRVTKGKFLLVTDL